MALSTPDFLQVKTYSAKALRAALMDRAIQSGVYGATDLLIAQRAGGANMSVDIGIGSAWVLGTTSSRQGAYHVYNDAVVNVAIAANASGNPRLDQIVLHVYDSIDGGAGTDTAAIEVIQGVATAGATLDTRTGAAALPANCLRLGDVLVANGAASIVNANLRDRRPWARGYFGRQSVTTQYAVSNVTWPPGPLDATNLSQRVECSGLPLRLIFVAPFLTNAAATALRGTFLIDGSPVDAEHFAGSFFNASGSGATGGLSLQWVTVPTVGSHLIRPGWNPEGAATTATVGTTGEPLYFVVEELVRQNTANNPAGYG